MRTILNSVIMSLALATTVPTGGTPLLNGNCGKSEWARGITIAANGAYSLLVMRDRKFVYLCLNYPASSLGMVDIFIKSPAEKNGVQLHASAKLGEAARGQHGWSPLNWWNGRGWSTQVNAFDAKREGRPTFHATHQKEFQLAIDRFGRGKWRLMAELVNDRDGSIASRLPTGSDRNDDATFSQFEIR